MAAHRYGTFNPEHGEYFVTVGAMFRNLDDADNTDGDRGLTPPEPGDTIINEGDIVTNEGDTITTNNITVNDFGGAADTGNDDTTGETANNDSADEVQAP